MKSLKYALLFVILAFSVLGVAWALGFANSASAIEAGGRVIAVIFAIAISFAAIEKFAGFRKTSSDSSNPASNVSARGTPVVNENESGGKGPQF